MAVEVASDQQDRLVQHVGIPWGFPQSSVERDLAGSNFLSVEHNEACAGLIWMLQEIVLG